MKLIPLTKGHFAQVDDEDFEFASKYHWYADKIRDRIYVKRRLPPRNGKQVSRYLHRELLGVTDRYIFVDHINNDPLDNTRSNLRLCSNAENLRNAKKRKTSKQPYKGIYASGVNSWGAKIAVDKRNILLGIFDCPIKAAKAYDAAAKIHHKEFAFLNFPEQQTQAP